MHTISSSLFRLNTKPQHRRLVLDTPDGDFLEVDWISGPQDAPVVIVLHGLEGSTDRYYVVDIMQECARRGFQAVALNFRSCGSRINRTRRFYHSGETGDLAFLVDWLREKKQADRIYATGFSLGGNVLTKYLGETGSQSGFRAAAPVSVPYDLKASSVAIGRGFNRVYEQYFLRSLRKKLSLKRKQFPDLPRFTGSTLYDFDDQITSRIHGFDDAEDYYHQCSGKRFLGEVETPTLLIHAKNDPMCALETMPRDVVEQNPNLYPLITHSGGHVGFWSQPNGWLRETVLDFFSNVEQQTTSR